MDYQKDSISTCKRTCLFVLFAYRIIEQKLPFRGRNEIHRKSFAVVVKRRKKKIIYNSSTSYFRSCVYCRVERHWRAHDMGTLVRKHFVPVQILKVHPCFHANPLARTLGRRDRGYWMVIIWSSSLRDSSKPPPAPAAANERHGARSVAGASS